MRFLTRNRFFNKAGRNWNPVPGRVYHVRFGSSYYAHLYFGLKLENGPVHLRSKSYKCV
ncbi:hypothetical protein HanRHA438_Chr11g0503991 [Helianthus annuus]|nr:hypothetical protein HanIR_Chr11g0528911 [Helianthus annuus]KAJ0870758.1 hypothetical protein HanRHA438_Chr11g0503991 [Helianthus annuus]